jgi:hypothetical protein
MKEELSKVMENPQKKEWNKKPVYKNSLKSNLKNKV